MASLGNCRLLTTCYNSRGVCPSREAIDDVCEVVRAQHPKGFARAKAWDAAAPRWPPTQPIMIPAPTGASMPAAGLKGGGPDGCMTPSTSSVASLMDKESFRVFEEDELGSPEVSVRAWRQTCDDQRARSTAERALIQQVVDWGPEAGRLVDLRNGKHASVTYWLRDDLRALCLFDMEEMQVRVYQCAQMERCEAADNAPEVSSREFFLGLGADAARRGIFVTMERFAHSVEVLQQGHVGQLRTQLLLLCRSRSCQKALLAAIRALMAELLVHDHRPGSTDAFHQLSDEREASASPLSRDVCWPSSDSSANFGATARPVPSPGPRKSDTTRSTVSPSTLPIGLQKQTLQPPIL